MKTTQYVRLAEWANASQMQHPRADTSAERACLAEEAKGRAGGRRHRRQHDFGELYLIQYATGVVKVGRSSVVGRRIEDHRRTAHALGVAIGHTWQSRTHCGHSQTETELIRLCRKFSPTQKGSRRGEYFTALDFDFGCMLADHVIDRAIVQQRIVEDAARRDYVDALIRAADGDLSMTWQVAHDRLAAEPSDEAAS